MLGALYCIAASSSRLREPRANMPRWNSDCRVDQARTLNESVWAYGLGCCVRHRLAQVAVAGSAMRLFCLGGAAWIAGIAGRGSCFNGRTYTVSYTHLTLPTKRI